MLAGGAKKLSGLQKEVLSLYRTILREAAKKDESHPQQRLISLWKDPSTSSSYARAEFRKQTKTVKKNDFRTIEFKIRHGYKQIKLLQMPGVKVVGGNRVILIFTHQKVLRTFPSHS